MTLYKGGGDGPDPVMLRDIPGRTPYINAFVKDMPIVYFDKAQIIGLLMYMDKYSPDAINYSGSLSLPSAFLEHDSSSKHIAYMEYMYDGMGSGYLNPTYSYRYPITELVEEYNQRCGEYLEDLNTYMAEHSPDTYICIVYIPFNIVEMEVPDGDMVGVYYGSPDIPAIWIMGNNSGMKQVIKKDILDQIFAFYKDGYSNVAYDIDKILGVSESKYRASFAKEVKSFRGGAFNGDMFREQLEAESGHIVPYSRMFSEGDRRMPYRYKDIDIKYVKRHVHLGQIKLFISELEFLNEFSQLSRTILYVGAAEGMHTVYMSKLFPEHTFILYDPREFYSGLKNCPNVQLRQQFFTDQDVEEYSGEGVLFMCDMRTMPADPDNPVYDEKFEEGIRTNMEQQRKWHDIMNPSATMLKFRLPYTPGSTLYLDGRIYYQAYAGSKSTELRLITQTHELREYDNTLVEEILYRFNACVRGQTFDGETYSDKALNDALRNYLLIRGDSSTPDRIQEMRQELGQIVYKMSIEDKIKIKMSQL